MYLILTASDKLYVKSDFPPTVNMIFFFLNFKKKNNGP